MALDPEHDDDDIRDVQRLLERLTLADKVRMMSGDLASVRGFFELATAYNTRPYTAGVAPELGVEGVHFTDGPRGVVLDRSTCFPVAMARGATWDPELEERVGEAVGVEARAQGANLFAGVCVNLLRHPAWGRAQETYGEDPFHLGELGAALVRGVQRNVMACVKHFACNSIENARFRVDVQVAERTLREVYLPHFRRCVEEGAEVVMSAYNRVNGQWCGHHHHLLTHILKREWGFRGFVISDFVFGVRDGPLAVLGGLDLEMPMPLKLGRRLVRAVRKGRVPEARIDDALTRMITSQRRIARARAPARDPKDVVACAEHRALAREVAQRSIVLLKNDAPAGDAGSPALPLDGPRLSRLAVIGRLARAPNLGDTGSSMVRPPAHASPLAGIKAWAWSRSLLFAVDHDDGRHVEKATKTAAAADAVIVVAGLSHHDEGENLLFRGGDRSSLTLRPSDEELIRRVARANPRTIVVLIGGSALITEAWRREVPAIVMAWYPGMEGGHAIADVLFGDVNPGGKLPCVFPSSPGQLPRFDPRARVIRYGYLHGQRLLDARGHSPAFAFGFGLSYTRFTCGPPQLARATDDVIELSVELRNVGARAGDEVVQVYVGRRDSTRERPPRALVAFRRVSVEAGQRRVVNLAIPTRRLEIYDDALGAWALDPGRYELYVGTSARAIDLETVELELTARA